MRLGDRYRIDGRLGAGGMGSVYIGTDERLGRKVAVKILRPELARQDTFVQRFRREARAVAALSHPNIATVFDYGEDGGRHFIVMEFIEGKDLAEVLSEQGALEPGRACELVAQACDALGHAHSAGVVHRDIKPANLIVGFGDRLRVTDFGIARVADDATLTATGSMLASVHYASPEQINGDKVGPASDIYSLGIVLYEALTGRPPFEGEAPIAIAMRHVSDDVPPPSRVVAELGSLDPIVGAATARDPRLRYSDASAMADVLRAHSGVRGPTPSRGSAGPTQRLRTGSDTRPLAESIGVPLTRYNPRRLGAIVIAALLGAAVLAGGLYVNRILGADPPAPQRTGAPGAAPESTPTPTPTPTSSPTPEATATLMPNVVGWQRRDADRHLKDMGFKVATEKEDSFETRDTVLRTAPEADAELQDGQTITLFVSSGKPPSSDEDEQD